MEEKFIDQNSKIIITRKNNKEFNIIFQEFNLAKVISIREWEI